MSDWDKPPYEATEQMNYISHHPSGPVLGFHHKFYDFISHYVAIIAALTDPQKQTHKPNCRWHRTRSGLS
uniref:Uncharacterized protein n=1 Tax=Anguilla anguilla TaxID=7936 RepID=A0A0E9RM10_ANGAN